MIEHIIVYSFLIYLYKDIFKRERDLRKFLEYDKCYLSPAYKKVIEIAEKDYKEILELIKSI